MKYYCWDCCLKIEDKETLDWHKSLEHDVKLIDENNVELMKLINKIEHAHDVMLYELAQELRIEKK